MKIAIITWYSNMNYGTVLQAFALQHYISESLNADVSLIAYEPNQNNILQSFEKKTEHLLYKLMTRVKKAFHDSSKEFNTLVSTQYKNDSDERINAFNRFLSQIKFVNAPDDLSELEDKFDLFICGSDQIWNPHILDSNYYLNFVKNKPKLSYATSFGINYIPDYAKPYIKDYLKDYRAVSLRENTCQKELFDLTQKEIVAVCDPTFLLTKEYWSSKGSKKTPAQKYCLTYFLGDTKLSTQICANVENELKIKNIILPSTAFTLTQDTDGNYSLGPDHFISLIENAEYIITDSFHAACFAIIFEKNFCVLNKHSKNSPYGEFSRIENLLSLIKSPNRAVDNYDTAFSLYNNPIDYASLSTELNNRINKSKEFLKENIY